jgi:hypothetical protein
VRRNCLPSGWPTAEFISVSAGKACPTSEKADKAKFAFLHFSEIRFSDALHADVCYCYACDIGDRPTRWRRGRKPRPERMGA